MSGDQVPKSRRRDVLQKRLDWRGGGVLDITGPASERPDDLFPTRKYLIFRLKNIGWIVGPLLVFV